ncbi:MAG: 50S ribosomal protein L25 [Candidatus Saccharibacteria bacterium]|nr:50S ribosomal protein L25 [Candidatus Saccharibacteria bacterium]
MSENKLTLTIRTITGKKLAKLRAEELVPSTIYGGNKQPILTQSDYNTTVKILEKVGYHSPLDLEVEGKKQLALVKNVAINPVSRRVMNVEFQAVSANEVVEATAPITLINFEESEASRIHLVLTQTLEEVAVKAKPSALPKELVIDATGLKTLEDKITMADLKLPKGVELADKELDQEQIIASLYDPAAEAAAREAETEEPVEAAEVPAENGTKPETE